MSNVGTAERCITLGVQGVSGDLPRKSPRLTLAFASNEQERMLGENADRRDMDYAVMLTVFVCCILCVCLLRKLA